MITPYLHWIFLASFMWLVFAAKFYDAMTKIRTEWWLGAIICLKVIKILIVITAILAVKYLTDIPVKPYALAVMGAYMVTIIFETAYFLYKKKKNEKNQ